MKENCTIIIPAIEINNDLIKCLRECNKLKSVKIKIFVITDSKVTNKFKNTIFKSYGSINMSQKRNLAVKLSNSKYLAFLDSDTYPTQDWLINGIEILKNQKDVGLVSGPDFPFPNQTGLTRIIGVSHKSFLLSGFKTFRKNIENEKKCKQVSSCNMILERRTFKKAKGMDPKIYIGEDADFCNRINKFTNIIYSPKVKIFHKTRSFIPFLAQRYTYGTCIFDAVKKDFSFKNFQYFGPLIITLFFLISLIDTSFLSNNYLLTFNLIFFSILIIESIKVCEKMYEIPLIIFIIFLGIVFFGLGSILRILGISKNVKSIYTLR